MDTSVGTSCECRESFKMVAYIAEQSLKKAVSMSTEVVFITNGSADWIRCSCIKYLPSLWPTVEPLRRISAKDLVGASSSDPVEWKRRAFAYVLDDFCDSVGPVFDEQRRRSRRNLTGSAGSGHRAKVVISVGDSLHERDALYSYFDMKTKGDVTNSYKYEPTWAMRYDAVGRNRHDVVRHDVVQHECGATPCGATRLRET